MKIEIAFITSVLLLFPSLFLSGNVIATSTRIDKYNAPFESPVKVNDLFGHNVMSSVSADSCGNVYIAWEYKNITSGSEPVIYFSKGTFDTSGWIFGKNVKVCTNPEITRQEYPSLDVDSDGNVYIAWWGLKSGYHDVYFSKGTYNGSNWSFCAPVRVNEPIGAPGTPSLKVASPDNVYIAWDEYRTSRFDVYFSNGTFVNGNWTFEFPRKVNDGARSNDQVCQSLAIDGNRNPYVIWLDYDSKGPNIMFSKGIYQAGGFWDFCQNVQVNDVNNTVFKFLSPSLAVSHDENAYVTWGDNRSGNDVICFSEGTSKNGTWAFSSNVIVSDVLNGTNPTDPYRAGSKIGIDKNGCAHIVWDDRRNGNLDIYYSKGKNNGTNWTFFANLRVNDDIVTENQAYPSMAVDSENIYAAWHAWGSGGISNPDIYFTSANLTSLNVDENMPSVMILTSGTIIAFFIAVISRRRKRK